MEFMDVVRTWIELEDAECHCEYCGTLLWYGNIAFHNGVWVVAYEDAWGICEACLTALDEADKPITFC